MRESQRRINENMRPRMSGNLECRRDSAGEKTALGGRRKSWPRQCGRRDMEVDLITVFEVNGPDTPKPGVCDNGSAFATAGATVDSAAFERSGLTAVGTDGRTAARINTSCDVTFVNRAENPVASKDSPERPSNKPRRLDGRSTDQVRSLFMKTGVVSQAKGSAYLEAGKTKVICSVYGPREIARRKDFTLRGQVNCELRFAQYSCPIRRHPVSDSEALQYSQLLREALTPVVCLYNFPKSTIDVFVFVLENDGGVLAASITTAGLALADAGIDMYDVVIGCSVRQQGNICLVDPTLREETAPPPSDGDQSFGQMTIGFMPALQQVATLVQDGELDTASIILNMKALTSACHKIYPLIKDTLLTDIKSKMKELITEEREDVGSCDATSAAEEEAK